jgi:hypothetical protein
MLTRYLRAIAWIPCSLGRADLETQRFRVGPQELLQGDSRLLIDLGGRAGVDRLHYPGDDQGNGAE